MPESWIELWRNASPLKRGLLAGVPAVVAVLAVVGAVFAVEGSGGSNDNKQVVAATDVPLTPSAVPPSATDVPPTPIPTEPPVSAGVQSGDGVSASAARGNAPQYVAPQGENLTGPGPEEGTALTLIIPKIGVNAVVNSRTVGTNGQMGNPGGPWDVVWYDFSGLGALGGYPGVPGANAVFAGHVDYIHVGPAVFWSIRDLAPGDIVTVNTEHGPINYSIQWSQWAGPDDDFAGYVAQNGQDTVTLVTCIGQFSGGHYSNRLIVRGVRV